MPRCLVSKARFRGGAPARKRNAARPSAQASPSKEPNFPERPNRASERIPNHAWDCRFESCRGQSGSAYMLRLSVWHVRRPARAQSREDIHAKARRQPCLDAKRSAELTPVSEQMTAVGFEPTPLRTGALSQRLRTRPNCLAKHARCARALLKVAAPASKSALIATDHAGAADTRLRSRNHAIAHGVRVCRNGASIVVRTPPRLRRAAPLAQALCPAARVQHTPRATRTAPAQIAKRTEAAKLAT